MCILYWSRSEVERQFPMETWTQGTSAIRHWPLAPFEVTAVITGLKSRRRSKSSHGECWIENPVLGFPWDLGRGLWGESRCSHGEILLAEENLGINLAMLKAKCLKYLWSEMDIFRYSVCSIAWNLTNLSPVFPLREGSFYGSIYVHPRSLHKISGES